MMGPTLTVYLIDSPTRPPQFYGRTGPALKWLCEHQKNVEQIDALHRSRLEAEVELLSPLLTSTYMTYMAPARFVRPDFNTLDVVIFQAREDHLGAREGRGVGGFYQAIGRVSENNRGAITLPHIVLSVLPGHEDRLLATALHEFGHYLRSVTVSQDGDVPFGRYSYDEGLSEHLVERILGKEHVLHSGPLGKDELAALAPLIEASITAYRDSQNAPKISTAHRRLGYRLGYHVVAQLLAEGRELNDLIFLDPSDAEQEVLRYCSQRVSGVSST